MKNKYKLILILWLFIPISYSGASPIIDFNGSGGGIYTDFGNNKTFGWSFNTNDSMIVTDLGLYDYTGFEIGLAGSHEVAIWGSTGSKLTSVTVGPSSVLEDGFAYENISPIRPLSIFVVKKVDLTFRECEVNTTKL